MTERQARTPAEIFRAELDPRNPSSLVVSAVTVDGRPLVRFMLGNTAIYHTPADALRIAEVIMDCAEFGKGGK